LPVVSLHGRRSLKSGKPGRVWQSGNRIPRPPVDGNWWLAASLSRCHSKVNTLLICHGIIWTLLESRNANWFSNLKREQEIAVKDLLLVKNFWPFYLQVMGKAWFSHCSCWREKI
jgi:hypothetical protein